MTVSFSSSRTFCIHDYSSSKSEYDITFPYNGDKNLIAVYFVSPNGINKTESNKYTIETVNNDPDIFGKLMFKPEPFASDIIEGSLPTKLIIRRETPLSQDNTFYSQTMYGKVTEDSLDKITRVLQEIEDRKIDSVTLSEQNTVLGFDADGVLTHIKGSKNIEIKNGEIDLTGEIPQADLPIATAEDFGIVKIGENVQVDNGTISVTFPDPYVLPEATAEDLGGVKVGENVDVNDGTISVTFPDPYELPPATTDSLGGVKVGNGLTATSDGTTSVKPATSSNLGGVKVGDGLTVTGSGTISVDFSDLPSDSSSSPAFRYENVNLGNRIRYSNFNKVAFFDNFGFVILGRGGVVLHSRNGYSWKTIPHNWNNSLWPAHGFGLSNMVGVCRMNDIFAFSGNRNRYDSINDNNNNMGVLYFGNNKAEFLNVYAGDMISVGSKVLCAAYAINGNTNNKNQLFIRDGNGWQIYNDILPHIDDRLRCQKLVHRFIHTEVEGQDKIFAIYSDPARGHGVKSCVLTAYTSDFSYSNYLSFTPFIQEINDVLIDAFTIPNDHNIYFLSVSGNIYYADTTEPNPVIHKRTIYRRYDGRQFNSMIADIDSDTELKTYIAVGDKGAMLYKTTDIDIGHAFANKKSRKYYLPKITDESFTSICVGKNLDSPTEEKVYVAVGKHGQIARSLGTENFNMVNESSFVGNNINFSVFKKIIYDCYRNRYIALLGNYPNANDMNIAVSKDCANWEYVLNTRMHATLSNKLLQNIIATPTSLLIIASQKVFRTTDLQTFTDVTPANSQASEECVFFKYNSSVLALVGKNSTGSGSTYIFISRDDGLTWESTFQASYSSTILLSATKLERRYYNGCWALVSQGNSKTFYWFNGAANAWQTGNSVPSDLIQQHGQCKAFVMANSDGTRYIAFNIGNIYCCSNNTWTRIEANGTYVDKYNLPIVEMVKKNGYIALRSNQAGMYHGGAVHIIKAHKRNPEYPSTHEIKRFPVEGTNSVPNCIGLINGNNPFLAYGTNIIYMNSPRKSQLLYKTYNLDI